MENIKLRNMHNTRDIGGMQGKFGKIKSKMILRGTALHKIEQDDMDILTKEYNLHTVIDLQNGREQIKRPDKAIDGVKRLSMPLFEDSIPGITHDSKEEFEKDYNNYNVDMPKMYRGILTEKEPFENVSKVIKCIVNLPEEDNSVLIHCSAGKDRTGIILMILQLMLGISKEDILEDYLYTNVDGRKITDEKIQYALEVEKNEIKAENLRYVYMARSEFINAAFDVIENEYSNLDDFLLNGIHLTQNEIDSFREKMIEK